jgi:hypothetical protein
LQVTEITLQLVGGEIRVKGSTDGGSCDGNNRYCILRPARQYDRYPVSLVYPESPQLPNCIVRQSPELAICHGGTAGSQDSILAGGSSRIEGKKIPQARKDPGLGLLYCRLMRRSVANLQQKSMPLISSYAILPL